MTPHEGFKLVALAAACIGVGIVLGGWLERPSEPEPFDGWRICDPNSVCVTEGGCISKLEDGILYCRETDEVCRLSATHPKTNTQIFDCYEIEWKGEPEDVIHNQWRIADGDLLQCSAL